MRWPNMSNSGLINLSSFVESQSSTDFLDNDAAFTASVNLNLSNSMQQVWSFLIVCIFKNTTKSQCSFTRFRGRSDLCFERFLVHLVFRACILRLFRSMINPVWPGWSKISHLAEHQRTEIRSVSHGIKHIYFICSCKSSQIYVHIVLWKVYNKYCLTVCSKNYMKYLFQMLYF